VLVLAVLGWNLWWVGRDFWPEPDLRVLSARIAQGQYDEAGVGLLERLRSSPNDGEARMLLARSLAARGRLRDCAEQLHLVPFWWPRKREALFLEGKSFSDVGRAREAESAWLACAADDPLHPAPAQYHKGATEGLLELYAAEDRWDDTKRLLWATYDLVDSAEKENVMIMRMRIEVQRISAASRVDRLRKFVAADAADWQAARALARVEQELGHDAEATRIMQLCLRAQPDDPATWADWLQILRDRHDDTGFTAAVARLPKSADGNGQIWAYRGLAREWSRDWAGAASAYRRAVQLKAFDEDAFYRLALAENRVGRKQQADQALERSKVLRTARSTLAKAFQTFLDAGDSKEPGNDRASAIQSLAQICEALGWPREAQAFRQLLTYR
jgi:tetratricopeptide (TPR) repeat protein